MVICADDPLIQELTKSCLDEATAERRARESVSSIISRKTLPRECTKITNERDKCHWNCTLESLTVQGKFKNICQLESQNQVWNRIQLGLPAGQLSFLLRAGSDTLPTPLNLKRWRLRVDAKCGLCGDCSPTVLHILNGCEGQ